MNGAPPFPAAGSDCFPFVVARLGAGSFAELAAFDLPTAPGLLAEVRARRRAERAAAAALIQELHASIHGCRDAALRRLLLGAKRDLFNGRRPDLQLLSYVGARSPEGLPHAAGYARVVVDLDEAELLFAGAFERDVTGARRALAASAATEDLQRPLVLSSRVALAGIRKYAARADGPPSRKEVGVERTLMKYLSRMHAKTSPFSGFCNLAVGRLTETDGAMFDLTEVGRPVSTVRISVSVWGKLRPLLTSDPAITNDLAVRANATLRWSADEVKFLVSFRNEESFRALPRHDGLEAIAALAAGAPARKDLVDRIEAAGLVEGDRNDVSSVVEFLIDCGFLLLDDGVEAMDRDWDRAVVRRLTQPGIASATAAVLVDTLNALRAEAETFGTADSKTRALALDRCSTRLAAAGAAVSPEKVLYEDSALPCRLGFNRAALTSIADALAHLTTALSFTDSLEPERRHLLYYFLERYGTDASVPLLGLYEDYRGDWLASDAAERETRASDPGAEQFRAWSGSHARALAAWNTAIISLIAASGVEEHRVDVSSRHLEAAARHVSALWPRGTRHATAAFLQMGHDDRDGVVAVLKHAGPGYGRAINRFFELFPDDVAEMQRAVNRLAARGAWLAEVRDTSLSDANVHPALVDFVISTNGTPSRIEGQLSLSDLIVSVDRTSRLWLTHRPTGRRIDIVDLGLQGPHSRSPLFRLFVSAFGRSQHLAFSPLVVGALAAWDRRPSRPGHGGVIKQPRVIYDHRVVLRRACWLIPADELPRRVRGESDAKYFERVDEWRESHGIPEYVYAIVRHDRTDPDRSARYQPDDRKPQFLAFRNWFSVSLFESLVSRVRKDLVLEEMFPLPQDMIEIDGRRHAIELVMQWTSGEC